MMRSVRSRLQASVAMVAIGAQLALSVAPAGAFCGFYVAKADSKMFNKSSKVVLARDGDQTAITMASDYEGEPKEFALVVPVPTFIERNQISVVEAKMVDHLDAYTAPRLVEYYDPDPCEVLRRRAVPVPMAAASKDAAAKGTQYRGVTIEAKYDVGEYDVLILSAEESDGLIAWLNDNGYKIPAGAEPVVGSYIKQKMRFFVAKVNITRMQELGRAFLRQLQVRYQTAKFMLPLRLGTVNASGPQDLIVFALSKRGRVEAANYRTVKIPSDFDVPLFVKDDFANFYRATFDRAVARESMRAVFVEYAWDMGWCDPCAADPLTVAELTALGAEWIAAGNDPSAKRAPRGGAGNALRHAAACALRCSLLSRRSHLHRNRRPREFSGALHHASSRGHRGKLPGRRRLPRRTAGAPETRRANARRRHRLVAERHRGAHAGRRPIHSGAAITAPAKRISRSVVRRVCPPRGLHSQTALGLKLF
jgi:hypothetical protein